MKENRFFEIRAAESASGTMTLTGRAVVFDTPALIHDPLGDYNEIIRSGALAGADMSDVHLFYGHDLTTVPLARVPKTMQLSISPAGLDITAQLPNTAAAQEVYQAVKRGDLSGMSFAFTVPAGGDTYDPETNTRTISRIDKILEISVVPYPAYQTTSVEARSAINGSLSAYKAKTEAKIKINQILKRGFQ
jgi:HK97 family phage prohead protease